MSEKLMRQALANWIGEIMMEMGMGTRPKLHDGTPRLGKFEAEELFRQGKKWLEEPKIEGLVWINKPCLVTGEDFSYQATCLCSFPKTNGKIRYIVEDRGRLFIQRREQLTFPGDATLQDRPCMYPGDGRHQTIGETPAPQTVELHEPLTIDELREAIFRSRDPMDASTLSGRTKTENLEKRLKVLLDKERHISGPDQTIGEALELKYEQERNTGDDPLGR